MLKPDRFHAPKESGLSGTHLYQLGHQVNIFVILSL